jgi:hypothetical protein
MTEYASLLKKAQEFDEKLKEVKGDMTTAQMNKFLEIQKDAFSNARRYEQLIKIE